MEREQAEKLRDVLLSLSARVDKSVGWVKEQAHEYHFKKYRSLAAGIMGYIYTEFLMPIYAKFPDLEPASLRDEPAPEDIPPLDRKLAGSLSSLFDEVLSELQTIRTDIRPNLSEQDTKRFDSGLTDVLGCVDKARDFVMTHS